MLANVTSFDVAAIGILERFRLVCRLGGLCMVLWLAGAPMAQAGEHCDRQRHVMHTGTIHAIELVDVVDADGDGRPSSFFVKIVSDSRQSQPRQEGKKAFRAVKQFFETVLPIPKLNFKDRCLDLVPGFKLQLDTDRGGVDLGTRFASLPSRYPGPGEARAVTLEYLGPLEYDGDIRQIPANRTPSDKRRLALVKSASGVPFAEGTDLLRAGASSGGELDQLRINSITARTCWDPDIKAAEGNWEGPRCFTRGEVEQAAGNGPFSILAANYFKASSKTLAPGNALVIESPARDANADSTQRGNDAQPDGLSATRRKLAETDASKISGMHQTEFQSRDTVELEQGSRLSALEVIDDQYFAAWRPGDGGQYWYADLSQSELKERDAEYFKKGYRLADVEIVGDEHIAIWQPGEGAQYWRSGLALDALKQQDADYYEQGLRLTELEIGSEGYLGIWQSGKGGQRWHVNLSQSQFHGLDQKYFDKGYRLADMEVYGGRYTAVWREAAGGAQRVRTGLNQAQFGRANDKAFDRGLRLTDLEIDHGHYYAVWRSGEGAQNLSLGGSANAEDQAKLDPSVAREVRGQQANWESVSAGQSSGVEAIESDAAMNAGAHLAGRWRTDYGNLRLHLVGNYVIGDYADNGVMLGMIDGACVAGVFTNAGRNGRFRFQISRDGSFDGRWGWHGEPMGREWSGTRLGQASDQLRNFTRGDGVTMTTENQRAVYDGAYGSNHGRVQLLSRDSFLIGNYADKGMIAGMWDGDSFVGRFTNAERTGWFDLAFKSKTGVFRSGSWGWVDGQGGGDWSLREAGNANYKIDRMVDEISCN